METSIDVSTTMQTGFPHLPIILPLRFGCYRRVL
jgi:hypothetical protein